MFEDKFKVGDRVKGFGLMGTVISVAQTTSYPVSVKFDTLSVKCGTSDIYDSVNIHAFTNSGKLRYWHDVPSIELVSRPKVKKTIVVERWMNIYIIDPTSITHPSEESANICSTKNRIACVKLTGSYEIEE